MEHTPGKLYQDNEYVYTKTPMGDIIAICDCGTAKDYNEDLANAEFIARAWNSHDDLLEACKYVVRWHRENDSGEGELYGQDFVTTCIAAIAKAEGRE